MKIAIDTSTITSSKAGIGYYTFELTKALLKLDKLNSYCLITNNKDNLKDFEDYSNIQIIEIKSHSPGLKWIWKVSRFLKKEKFDLLISPSLFTFGVLFPKTIQIIHDISPITYSQFWPKKASLMFKLQLKLEVFRAKKFVTISKHTYDEFVAKFKRAEGKTFVIGTGMHEWVYKESTEVQKKSISEKYNLPENYFISVSTLQPRKNYINMIKGFQKFSINNPSYKYLIIGQKGWFYEEILKIVKELDLEEKVIFLGYVPEEDIASLVDLSKGLIFCSYEEGFGLPAVEALYRGKQIVASNIQVLREGLGENAIYVDPTKADSIKVGLESMLSSPKSIDKKWLERHNWNSVAGKVIEQYK
jgi:glycosyltransferase involved in cell wall biosynthesis